MVRYWSKITDCNLPHLYLAPQFGVTEMEFRRDLWHQKLRVPALSCGVVCVILCLAVLVQCRLVTGQTHDNSMYRASIASCGNNENSKWRLHYTDILWSLIRRHSDPVASIERNFSDRILALRPAVGTARTRNDVLLVPRNVTEQFDTESPTCLRIGTVREQSGQESGTVGWNISSMNGVLSSISTWYFKRLSCYTHTHGDNYI